ncbi:MAG: hypothetical protein R3E75_11655 [Steroidobacteraceae bacterium]
MKVARPSAAEERWLLLASRYPALRTAVESTGLGGGWETTTWLARVLGFLLGLFATTLLAGALVVTPSPLLLGGLLWILAAEWLVAKRRVFRSGIEEALYLIGAGALVVQLLIWTGQRNEAATVALCATVALLVGWRLLNPLFTTLAAAGYSIAIALFETSLLGGTLNSPQAGIGCMLMAVVALFAGGRTWQRPAHDRMLDGLVIVMPWLGHGWLLLDSWGRHPAHAHRLGLALALALAFFAANVFAGVRRRQHAPLIGALGNLACAAYALHKLLDWPAHWQLMAAGGLLLLAAIALERGLRNRREGITSSPIQEPAALDLAQLAGATSLAPAPAAAPQPACQGQGGDFGGAGASGRF